MASVYSRPPGTLLYSRTRPRLRTNKDPQRSVGAYTSVPAPRRTPGRLLKTSSNSPKESDSNTSTSERSLISSENLLDSCWRYIRPAALPFRGLSDKQSLPPAAGSFTRGNAPRLHTSAQFAAILSGLPDQP